VLVKAPMRSRSSDRLVRIPQGWIDRSETRHEAGITLSQTQPQGDPDIMRVSQHPQAART
jgi:hypothetical protein